jgi:hypothetical protein
MVSRIVVVKCEEDLVGEGDLLGLLGGHERPVGGHGPVPIGAEAHGIERGLDDDELAATVQVPSVQAVGLLHLLGDVHEVALGLLLPAHEVVVEVVDGQQPALPFGIPPGVELSAGV